MQVCAIFSQLRQFGGNIELIAPASFVSLAIPLAVFFASSGTSFRRPAAPAPSSPLRPRLSALDRRDAPYRERRGR